EIGRSLISNPKFQNLKLDCAQGRLRAIFNLFPTRLLIRQVVIALCEEGNVNTIPYHRLGFHVPCATVGIKVSRPGGGKSRARPFSALRYPAINIRTTSKPSSKVSTGLSFFRKALTK